MHKLGKELGPGGMDAVDDPAPGLGVSRVRDAGLEEVALAGLLVDIGAFGDQQGEPAVGENAVVGPYPIGGQTFGRRAYSRHRRQGDTVGELNVTDCYWAEQGFMRRANLGGRGTGQFCCPFC